MPGGFNHYEQSLRIVDILENDGAGLNLTWKCATASPSIRKEVGCSGRNARESTVEHDRGVRSCEWADLIAYVNHDIDDATRAGLLKAEDLPAEPVKILGRSSSSRIGTLVTDVVTETLNFGLSEIRMRRTRARRRPETPELPV